MRSRLAPKCRGLCGAVALFACVASLSAGAQIIAPSAARNVVYAEFAGAAGLFSLNYERLTEEGLYFRGGTGFWAFTNLDNVREEITTVVTGVSRRFDVSDQLKQGEGRIVEAGLAVVAGTYKRTRYDVVEVDGSYASLVPTVGVRAEPPGGGYTWRLTFTPLIPIVNRASAFPRPTPILWAGISAGYIFR